ncbi:organic cation transporter-like protein, partial [Saccostrea cucullata]|uniref:organic cation transporter-like protein n=1 Tax=Saccostrea cuccullata TaxID=36930 RepID=UPI002ED414EF
LDLFCDRAYLAEVLQSLLFVGQMVGAAFASSLSDRFGRKTVYLGSTLLTFIIGISVAFAENYITLAILKFILGVLQQGMVVIGSVLSLELFPEKTRFISEGLQALFWTSGLVVMAPIAYLMQNYSWRYLQIALTSFSAISLFQFWFQDESLRWLAVNGKYEEANRIVRKVTRWNKLNYEDLKKIVDRKMARAEKDKCLLEDTKRSEQSKEIIIVEKLSIVKGDDDLSITIELFMNVDDYLKFLTFRVTNTLTYFGLTLTSTSLAGNRYLNFFLSVCVEYIGGILEFLMLRCLGRRTITVIFHIITGSALALSTALNHFSDGSQPAIMTSVVMSFIGKLSITGSFSLLFLFTAELYPTNLRNAGLGISSSFSRVGAIVFPFVGILATEVPWAPGTIFSSMCFIVVVLAVYLPETRGWDLPQTIAEVKVWYKEKSGFQLKKSQRTDSVETSEIK